MPGMKLALGIASVGGIVLAGLTGCSAPVPLETYLSQEVSWSSCEEDVILDPDFQSDVFSSALDMGEVACATVNVPASYSGDASGKEFALQLMRVGSASADLGTVFINPGGPGGSGVEQVQSSEFPAELLAHYSFIGFDPRGVNFSTFTDGTEIRCDDQADLSSYFTGEGSPSTDAEYEENISLSNEFQAQCAQDNPLWWTLSTENVVQDLEILRSVVTGDEPLNFIGSSYGTTIAGMYVTEFPEYVGKIVLDSPTTVESDVVATAVAEATANEAKFRLYLQGYAAHAGVSFDDAFAKVLEMKKLADDDQLIGFAGIQPNEEYETAMVSSEPLFIYGIQALNYYPETDAVELFIQGMDDLVSDQWNATFEWLALDLDGYDADSLEGDSLGAKDIIRSNEYEVMSIVNTMDYSAPPLSDEEQERIDVEIADVAPLLTKLYADVPEFDYSGEEEYVDWLALALEDDSIPDPSTTRPDRTNTSGKQLLIVGSLHESVTPFAYAQATAELLTSPLISVDTGIHAPAAYYDNACVNEVLIRFFVKQEIISSMNCPAS
jgi:pimeloyl-ACP methyl ester carboxylesterase